MILRSPSRRNFLFIPSSHRLLGALCGVFVIGASLLLYQVIQQRAEALDLQTPPGVNYTWKGAVSSDWNTADNWSPSGIPSKYDSVRIPSGESVKVATNVYVRSLTVEAGSRITGAGNVAIMGEGRVIASKLTGPGGLTVVPGAKLFLESGTTTGPLEEQAGEKAPGRPLNNLGTLVIGNGELDLGARVVNGVRATLEFQGEGSIRGNSTLINRGTLHKTGNGVTLLDMKFTNEGIVKIENGQLRLKDAYVQTAGETSLNEGTISAPGGMLLKGGKVTGSGKIHANVTNDSGTISIGASPGYIEIIGNYIQWPGGILDMEIAGLTPVEQYDKMVVGGTAQLAGAFNLFLLNGYIPPAGTSFEMIETVGGITGRFDTFGEHYNINVGLYLTPVYGESIFSIGSNSDTVIPTASVSSPLNNTSTPVASASGAASDAQSGVASVTLSLARFASLDSAAPTGYWDWNARAFTTTYSASLHEKTVTGTTSWTTSLPTLPGGYYGVRATSKDRAKNIGRSAWSRFSVPLPAYTISGRVLNSLGVAMPNIQIKRTAGSSTATTTTALDGTYVFRDVPSGSYTLAPNQTPATAGMTFYPPSITVSGERGNVTNQNFTVWFTISGTVTTRSGSPLAGVVVWRKTSTSSTSTITDSAGKYTFRDVRSGIYTIAPGSPGFSPVSKEVSVTTVNLTNINFIK